MLGRTARCSSMTSGQRSAGAAQGRLAEPLEDGVPVQGRRKGFARTPLSQTSKSSRFRGDLSLLPCARRWLGQGPQDQWMLSRVRLRQVSKDRQVRCQLWAWRSHIAEIWRSREGAGLQCSPTGAGRYPVLPSVRRSPNAAN